MKLVLIILWTSFFNFAIALDKTSVSYQRGLELATKQFKQHLLEQAASENAIPALNQFENYVLSVSEKGNLMVYEFIPEPNKMMTENSIIKGGGAEYHFDKETDKIVHFVYFK